MAYGPVYGAPIPTSSDEATALATHLLNGLMSAGDKVNLDTLADIVEALTIANEGDGAGLHNSIYRGKYLGDHVTDEQWEAIRDGSFRGLWIGDYWTIDGVNWRVADFDYFLGIGKCADHHVVIVPDTSLYNAHMNTSNTTNGGYVGSAMYKTKLATAKTMINTAFGSEHVLVHMEALTNAVSNGAASGWANYDTTVELMNESMVTGLKIVGNRMDIGYAHGQFNLFVLARYKRSGSFWLRDVTSASCFAWISSSDINLAIASQSFGVRPYCCIYQA